MPAPDKILHFWVSFFLAQIDPLLAWTAGVGKEVYDFVQAGFMVPAGSFGDLVADGLGVLFGAWVHSWF